MSIETIETTIVVIVIGFIALFALSNAWEASEIKKEKHRERVSNNK